MMSSAPASLAVVADLLTLSPAQKQARINEIGVRLVRTLSKWEAIDKSMLLQIPANEFVRDLEQLRCLLSVAELLGEDEEEKTAEQEPVYGDVFLDLGDGPGVVIVQRRP